VTLPGLTARHLGRRSPPSAWEAYFLIGIFPAKSALRWCKLHVFSGGARPDHHCLSAVEALDGAPERLLLRATADHVAIDRTRLSREELTRAREGWDVRAEGLAWGGAFPDLRLELASPPIAATQRPRDVLWWVKIPRVLSYFSAFGALAWEGPEGRCEGLGVVEHAWGADTRLDVAHLAPRRWQWDVLALEGGGFAAGLALGIGRRLLGPRSGGQLDGEPLRDGHGIRIEVLEHGEEKGRRVPLRWRGAISIGRGTLRYEARATTPVADTVPGGGFLGFEFEGERIVPRGVGGSAVRGTGFTEYRAASP
jgi:hypothetical protein